MSYKRSFTSEKSTPRSTKSKSASPKAEMASAAAPRTSLPASSAFSDYPEEVSGARTAKKGAAAKVMSPAFGQSRIGGAFTEGGFDYQARDAKPQTFAGAIFGLPLSTAEPKMMSAADQKTGGKYEIEVVPGPSKARMQPDDMPSFIDTMAPYSTLCTVASAARVTAALRRMLVDSAAAGRVDYTPLKEAKDSEYARDRAVLERTFLEACAEVYVGRVFSDLRALATSVAGDVNIGGSQFQISVIVGAVAGREQCCVEVKRTQGEALQHGWLMDEVQRAMDAAGLATVSLCDARSAPATLEDVSVLAADLARDTRLTADMSDSATTVDDFEFDVSYDLDLDLGDLELPADGLMRSDSAEIPDMPRMSDKDIETFGDFFVDAGTQVAEWMSLLLDERSFHELRKNAAVDLAAELLSDATRDEAMTVLIGECDGSLDALLLRLLRVCVSGDRYGCDAFTTRAVLIALGAIMGSLEAPSEALKSATVSDLRESLPKLSEFWQAPKRSIGAESFYFAPSKQIERECDFLLASMARA